MDAMERGPCVYILASGRNGTLYAGVTADLPRRIKQHRNREASRFAARYGVSRLVHVEFHATMPEAIAREKQIKRWKRAWKLALIEQGNPTWRDLYADMLS